MLISVTFLFGSGGMHTLCLLDIKVKEPDFDALAKGKLKYLPPRFMTVSLAFLCCSVAAKLKPFGCCNVHVQVNVAIRQLLEANPELANCHGVGMARLGQPSQTVRVVASTAIG